MTRTLVRRRRGERGAALLEAAITVPIILLISVGIFEFGRAYQTWQVLTNAAREGARIACLEGTTDSDVRNRVRSYLTGGGLKTLADSNILVDRAVPMTGGGSSTASRVTVNYPFSFMVLNPVVKLVTPSSNTGKPITMSAATLMRNE
jgi:Flp pilus assembly protein TadG